MSGLLLATRRRRRVTRLGHLRACLPVSALVAGLGLLTGLAVAGPGQGVGVVLGVAVAAATFAFGALVVDAADRRASSLVLPVGLAAYGVTVVVLGVLVLRFRAAADRSSPDCPGGSWQAPCPGCSCSPGGPGPAPRRTSSCPLPEPAVRVNSRQRGVAPAVRAGLLGSWLS